MLTRFGVSAIDPELAPPKDVSGRRLRRASCGEPGTIDQRYARAGIERTVRTNLLDTWTQEHTESHAAMTEHFIGTVKLPVGIAGPLRVCGQAFKGDCFVPLATTEAALVASIDRGVRAVTDAGGVTALVVSQGVQRAPAFVFESMTDAANFVAFAAGFEDELRAAAEATTRFGKVIDIGAALEGNCAWIVITMDPADASGQNMVTFAARAAVRELLAHAPVQPKQVYEEGNLSGDKKPSHLAFMANRGRKVCAEIVLPEEIVRRRFHVSVARMVETWGVLAMGGIHSGSIGVQGHYANTLAAFFIATGQDPACVAESSVGVTRFAFREGDAGNQLYASVSLPGLMIAAVGGGTGLPSQQACFEILGIVPEPKEPGFAAMALAEIATAACLAGELSIIGALAAGDFGDAHHRLARER